MAAMTRRAGDAGRWLGLVRHPRGAGDPVRALDARAARPSAAELALGFRLRGDCSRISAPPPREPRMASELWRHTCFEAFVAAEGAPSYHELNFAPSGEWAVLGFRGYRDGGPLGAEMRAPRIAVRADGDCLELDAVVALDALLGVGADAPLRIGLSAVVEASDGTLSYWALRHPASQPDFHHPDSLALRLEEKGVGSLFPEPPEGCFAKKTPDPFFASRPADRAGIAPSRRKTSAPRNGARDRGRW